MDVQQLLQRTIIIIMIIIIIMYAPLQPPRSSPSLEALRAEDGIGVVGGSKFEY